MIIGIDREESAYTPPQDCDTSITCPPRFADEGGLFAMKAACRFSQPTRRSCTPSSRTKRMHVLSDSRDSEDSRNSHRTIDSKHHYCRARLRLIAKNGRRHNNATWWNSPKNQPGFVQSPHTITVCVETTHKGTIPGWQDALLQGSSKGVEPEWKGKGKVSRNTLMSSSWAQV